MGIHHDRLGVFCDGCNGRFGVVVAWQADSTLNAKPKNGQKGTNGFCCIDGFGGFVGDG